MKSLQASARAKGKGAGFTLLETLLVVSILALLFAIGLPVAFNFYQAYQFDSEYELLFSLLEQARNQALTNYHEASHGLSINSVNFVLFQGSSFAARTAAQDKTFPRNSAITIAGPSEVVFSQLDGTVASSTFTVSNSYKSHDLYLNSEGSVYSK